MAAGFRPNARPALPPERIRRQCTVPRPIDRDHGPVQYSDDAVSRRCELRSQVAAVAQDQRTVPATELSARRVGIVFDHEPDKPFRCRLAPASAQRRSLRFAELPDVLHPRCPTFPPGSFLLTSQSLLRPVAAVEVPEMNPREIPRRTLRRERYHWDLLSLELSPCRDEQHPKRFRMLPSQRDV